MRDAGPDQGPHLTCSKKFVIIVLENIKYSHNNTRVAWMSLSQIQGGIYYGSTTQFTRNEQ